MCSTQLTVQVCISSCLQYSHSVVITFVMVIFLNALFSLVEKSSEMKNRLQKASKTKWPWKSGRRCLKWAKIRTFITICVPASSPLSMVRAQLLLQRKEISPVKILVLTGICSTVLGMHESPELVWELTLVMSEKFDQLNFVHIWSHPSVRELSCFLSYSSLKLYQEHKWACSGCLANK